MATEIYGADQSTTEIRAHFVDFSNDMPSGVVVNSATATLTGYPAGGTCTLSVGVIASNIVPVTVTTPTLAGQYTIDVLATLSDGEKSSARLIVPVYWETARSTMQPLVDKLRGMTETTVNDYSVGGVRYWSDADLIEVIDRHQKIYDFEPLTCFPQRAGSYYQYKIFYTNVDNWELGPVILDANAGTISTGYSFDNNRGVVTFTADQAGSARFISGTAYNLNAAAADVWRLKVGHYAAAYDVSTDNHNLSRSQLMSHAQKMISMYTILQASAIDLERSDT